MYGISEANVSLNKTTGTRRVRAWREYILYNIANVCIYPQVKKLVSRTGKVNRISDIYTHQINYGKMNATVRT